MVESGALEKRYAYMASRVRIPSPPPVLRIEARVYVFALFSGNFVGSNAKYFFSSAESFVSAQTIRWT